MRILLDLYPGDVSLLFAAGVVLEATAVILIAWVASIVLRRASAPTRYGLWLAALLGVLAGPLIVWSAQRAELPGWTIPVAVTTGRVETAELPTPSHAVPAPIDVSTVEPPPASTRDVPAIAETQPITTRDLWDANEGLGDSYPAGGVSAAPWETRGPLSGDSTPSPEPVEREWSTRDAWRFAVLCVIIVWGVGVLILAGRLIWGCAVTVVLRRSGRPLDLDDALLDDVRRALGTRTLPRVVESARAGGPLSVGVIRPAVVLPEGLGARLDPDELRDVLVHECAHVLRRDPLVGLLQRIVQMVLWPHPLVYVMGRQLARAREEICDNHVLGQGERRRYARALLSLAEGCPSPRRVPVTMQLIHPHWTLEERVGGLLDERRKLMTRMNRWVFAAMLVGLLSAGLLIGGLRAQRGPRSTAPKEAKPPDAVAERTRPEAPKAEGPVAAPASGETVVLPHEKPENAAVLKKLKETKVSFTFADQPFMEALDFLQTLGNVNVVADKSKFEDPDQAVTLKLTNVSLEAALRLLTEQLNLKYVVRDGVVFISDEEGVRQPPVTAVYDVKDLLEARPGIGLTREDSSTRAALLEIVEIIKATVEPGTWDEGCGNAIKGSTLSGLLVITHTPETHRQVQELLANLRRARMVLVRRTYPVKDLQLKPGETVEDVAFQRRAKPLMALIASVIEPETWTYWGGPPGGGPCSIEARDGELVVKHTEPVQARVKKLLEALRAEKKTKEAGASSPAGLQREIDRMKIELDEMLKTQTDRHPEVIKLKMRVAAKEQELLRAQEAKRLQVDRLRLMEEQRRRRMEEAVRRREASTP